MSYNEPSSSNQSESNNDGRADAFAAVAIIALVVTSVALWLHGMPT